MREHALPILYVAIIACIGGWLFSLLSLPIPWMIGPLFTVLLAQFFIRRPLKWPAFFRNIGLVIIGITIGENFSLTILQTMGTMFWYMLAINIIFILLCLLLAFITAKYTNMSLHTAILASVPGALGQIIVFSSEQKDVDLAAVTYFHLIRVLAVVSVIPFLVSGHIVQQNVASITSPLWAGIILIAASFAFALIASKFHMPTPFFLGPVLFGILLNVVQIDIPTISANVLHLAQIAVGAHIGLLLTPGALRLPKRTLLFGLMNVVLLMFVSFLCAKLVMTMLNYTFATSFLSTAPGGMDQMALIATSIHAEADIVTVFQLARMLFLSFVIIPLLKKYSVRLKH
ncbi:AbrB family transcriptional regulator [Metasolibacillus fluoroglycofenilyticus]|uniref:AbrB family transcriptional regulator n=1 Tax=Metasolibacillus fluoroglycofenilyticus TaxID=1239396 RepID=UPI000D334DAC|nr:AbrB family transcriptional regulator [Metasolibacillus fluoroglycofenilyticus]